MRTLFCEDEPTIRRLIELSLRGTREEFRIAAGGREALELARRWRPDVLVTDIAMPGMDGLQLAAAVRADPELREMRIVFMSAATQGSLEHRAGAYRPVGHLRKPFGPAALRDLLGELARRPPEPVSNGAPEPAPPPLPRGGEEVSQGR